MHLIVLLFSGEAGEGAGVGVWRRRDQVSAAVSFPHRLKIRRQRERSIRHPINGGLFAVTYIVVGLNSTAISTEVGGVLLIAFARTFASGAAVYAISTACGVAGLRGSPSPSSAPSRTWGLTAAVALSSSALGRGPGGGLHPHRDGLLHPPLRPGREAGSIAAPETEG